MNDLYDNHIQEHVADADSDEVHTDELLVDDGRVESALVDLKDDFFRSGGELQREEVDRAAVRHKLSIAEVAVLMRRAEDADLLEDARESVTRLDSPQEAYEQAGESVDLLATYINDLRRYPLLDASEEVALARTIETGKRAATALEGDHVAAAQRRDLELLAKRGEAARQRFVASNLRLSFNHAKVRRGQGLDFLDLLQEGTLGLVRAVDKFDYRLGYKFSTYATWWVRQSMDRALADKGRVIRLPVHIVERIRKIRSTERKLEFDLGREPTVTEVATKAALDPADVAFLRDVSRDVMSLDAPVGDEPDALRMLDLVPDPDADVEAAALEQLERDDLERLLAMLDDTERQVLKSRYGLNGNPSKTLEEIGTTFGVTRERVRQIQARAERKLEVAARSTGLFSERLAA